MNIERKPVINPSDTEKSRTGQQETSKKLVLRHTVRVLVVAVAAIQRGFLIELSLVVLFL